jgi:predicted CopG family antitoxin
VASGGGEINSSLSMSDYAKRLMEVKREIDIEVTQPYLPSSSELSHVGWI